MCKSLTSHKNKSCKSHKDLWTSYEQVKTTKSSACHEHEKWTTQKQVLNKPWTIHEKVMNKSWTSYQQVTEHVMKKYWTGHKKVVNKSW